ncbi:hypothetical protein K466DRAFT_405142 [Polyporus arcularius HHB13444]|uniref:Uncharacterized protein n=1 Tax=Polyporus arcularius HHB13444 TaxID=1314778 RepID=A0A5C3PJV6_9APHY|nr:hypothetical protein K466DRAFT_405142 [Polyporus arcularius HHB13444]
MCIGSMTRRSIVERITFLCASPCGSAGRLLRREDMKFMKPSIDPCSVPSSSPATPCVCMGPRRSLRVAICTQACSFYARSAAAGWMQVAASAARSDSGRAGQDSAAPVGPHLFHASPTSCCQTRHSACLATSCRPRSLWQGSARLRTFLCGVFAGTCGGKLQGTAGWP